MIMRHFLVLGLLLLGGTAYFIVIERPPTVQELPATSSVVRLQTEGLLPIEGIKENEQIEHGIFEVPAMDETMFEAAMENMSGMDMGGMDMSGGAPAMEMGTTGSGMDMDARTEPMEMTEEAAPMDMGAGSDTMQMTGDDGPMQMQEGEGGMDIAAETPAMPMAEGQVAPDMAGGAEPMDMSKGDETKEMAETPGPMQNGAETGPMEMAGEEERMHLAGEAEQGGAGMHMAPAMGCAGEGGLAFCAEGTKADREITLGMHEWGYDRLEVEVQKSERVRFTVRNDGKLLHEFMVMTMPAMRAVNYRAKRADWSLLEHEALFEKSLVLPGEEFSFVVEVRQRGSWMFMCMLPYHMQLGMMGQIATPGAAMEM